MPTCAGLGIAARTWAALLAAFRHRPAPQTEGIMPVATKRRARRPVVKNLERREADRALERELIWAVFQAESVRAYQTEFREPDAHEQRTLQRLQTHYEGVREICRRVKRAFTDPERVAKVIALEHILTDFRELAA